MFSFLSTYNILGAPYIGFDFGAVLCISRVVSISEKTVYVMVLGDQFLFGVHYRDLHTESIRFGDTIYRSIVELVFLMGP